MMANDMNGLPHSHFPCLDARPEASSTWQSVEVSFNDARVLQTLCKRCEISPSAIFKAAWALVLRCYIGNPDICFTYGFVDERKVLGCSTVSDVILSTCRADLTPLDNLSQLLSLMNEVDCGGYWRGHGSHGQGHSLAANTCVLYREKGGGTWPGVESSTLQDVLFHRSSNKFEIVVYADIGAHDLISGLFYRESTLSVVSAANVANVYEKAMCEILRDRYQAVSSLNLVTHRDLNQARQWNQVSPHKINACVHDLVLRQAKAAPHTAAVCSWDGDLTYEQLDTLSLPLAQHLVQIGVRSETLVPVCFTKSLYVIVAMVAIHRAGGAFVPLDPSHPQERLCALLRQTEAKILLAGQDTAKRFHGLGLIVVEVSKTNLDALDRGTQLKLPHVSPNNAAFILFTSGSTGRPKGVVQEHGSVCTNSLAHGRAMKVSAKSRVFQYASFAFDVSMMDIFTTMLYGGCICMPSEHDRLGDFAPVMREMRVNWVLFTPSVASLIKPEDVPTLEVLVLGGEAVHQENVDRWSESVCLLNCYGPAESGACAIGEFSRPRPRPANVGRQFGGSLNWIIDAEDHDRLVPIGMVGELAVEGPTLARGYLDDLPRTQQSFIKNPAWSASVGLSQPRRIYKTGDLVRQSSDGTLEYVGRKDGQLKIRGQRVEIGEIESHLAKCSNIAFSTVVRPSSGPYAHCLVGVIQLRLQNGLIQEKSERLELISPTELSAKESDVITVRDHLKANLPSYMVPQHFVIVKNMLFSLSGKIDKKAVEASLQNISQQIISHSKIRGSMSRLRKDEHIALSICSKVLSMAAKSDAKNYDAFKKSDFSLAAMSLDSIQYISLMMYMRRRYKVKITLDDVMLADATIRTLANVLQNLGADGLKTSGYSMPKDTGDVMARFLHHQTQALGRLSDLSRDVRNVFLTGATGFLGTRILYHLCVDVSISRVVVHVRSQSEATGLRRVIKAARNSSWWQDKWSAKLEAWSGDLAKSQLGLNARQWSRLCGNGEPSERITSIIHNGAAVNWNATLDSLKATNVDSTIDLLHAAAHSAALTNFVFVSGGQRLKVKPDKDSEIAEDVVRSTGYAQSKFLAEVLVKSYAQQSVAARQHVSIVKPGYIIGTVQHGRAQTEDFIWRLAATCLDKGVYNADDKGSWLFVSDVDRVASAITDSCSSGGRFVEPGITVTKILDGLPVPEFWGLLAHAFKCDISPLESDAWLSRIHSNIADTGEDHKLWPLLQTVESGKGVLGAPEGPNSQFTFDAGRVKAALRRNVEHLRSIGFLRKVVEELPVKVTMLEVSPLNNAIGAITGTQVDSIT